MSIPTRLATTAIAGLAGFAVVGIYSILFGLAETFLDVALLMLLFVAVYVPGVFGARRMLVGYAEHVLAQAPALR